MNQPLRRIESTFVVLPAENIDTDQICPARFLTTTSRDGFAPALFADWRYDKSGALRPEFPMNRPEAKGARILVTGRNFGCGSSREHAVWALRENGIQAVVATAVADIFKRNALKNGVVPVVIDAAAHAALLADPAATVLVDLEKLLVAWPGGEAKFAIEPFARHCLMEGVDELGYLLNQDAAIAGYEGRMGR
ncbi:MAG TPA: 3-isopropylmalate dehydratase small subunit [Vicinamibacteria bacterium]|nr:3-isopropylmalate dehydratase small subunit [Vicinamibacteria bacterium]